MRLPSPAMTVACIALAVALSGASYAAIVLPKNSVGTKQLRKNAVTSAKVKNNAITGAKVNEATLGQVPSAANAEMLDGLDSSAFQRVFGGPRQLVVPAAAFVPLTDATEFERNVIYSGGIKPKALGSVVAPVQFPDGAVVTKVSWYHGAGPAEAGLLHLEANDINPAGGSHVDMVDLKSALCASQPCAPIVATTIASAAIDNVNTHYGLFLTDQSAAVDLVTWKVVIEYVLGPQAAALARTSQGGSGE